VAAALVPLMAKGGSKHGDGQQERRAHLKNGFSRSQK